jgi:L-glyceraldehyde 3-phosphate reductase
VIYSPNPDRYNTMLYRRVGNSGLKLPAISLGFWHNFGAKESLESSKEKTLYAFDHGICHFDLANNYGPPPGSAESVFGEILKKDLLPFRDEITIATKAGWQMWPGPYGDFGSRKYLIASLDQSLKRMGLEYVDIFYHHRRDPETPLEETMQALDYIVRSGRALYVGISSYDAPSTQQAYDLLKSMGTPCLIHQPQYNMFNRSLEGDLHRVLIQNKIGCITFSPLAQGLLTDRYLNGIPKDSRVKKSIFLTENQVEESMQKVTQLHQIAKNRNQKLSQMALAFNLRLDAVSSVLIGASHVSQIQDAIGSLQNLDFSAEELQAIDRILNPS